MDFLRINLLLCVYLSTRLYGTDTAIRAHGRTDAVTVGDNATLFCWLVGTNEKPTKITWQKTMLEFPTNRDFFAITPDGKTEHLNGLDSRVMFIGNTDDNVATIYLRNVTFHDEGIYTCIFSMLSSGKYETKIHLTVQVPPVVSVTTDVIPVVGESEVILASCTAVKARPAPEVSWSLGALNDSITVKTHIALDTNGFQNVKSHLISAASKELNQQKVQCVVKHTSLKKELILDHELIIHYPPQVVNIVSVNVPTTTQEFRCIADANPPPTKFIWSRVSRTPPSRVDGDRLIIKLISDDNGLYVCNASNQYGFNTGLVHIYNSSEPTTVCWSLFTGLLFIILTAFLIWKCNIIGKSMRILSQLRGTIWCSEHALVPTVSASPTDPQNYHEILPLEQ